MLNKIQRKNLDQAPAVICKTSAKLAKELDKLGGQKIVVFLAHSADGTLLMFGPEVDGTVDKNKAIAFEIPCPPFCTKGDNLYTEVP
jgi:hypothetical protein